jgi:hypothetical protein
VRIATALLLVLLPASVDARDNGRFAGSDPEIKTWFDTLTSGKGRCCSFADGEFVADVDWTASGGHYRVRLDSIWIDVPDEAVITEPNRVGRTIVWPFRVGKDIAIRCFMPGAMI